MADLRNPNSGLVTQHSDRHRDGWRKNLGRSRLDLDFPRRPQWFTGKQPQECPGFGASGRLRSLDIPNLDSCTRQDVLDYFDNSWTLTEVLFAALIGDEPFYRPPYHWLRHPLIFYYVHPAALYINKLQVAGLLPEPVDAYFEALFETGVDEMSWDDMTKNEIEWPPVDEAHRYRQAAYKVIRRVIKESSGLSPGHSPIRMDSPLWALFMGFEHERIHLETSSVLIRELPAHLVRRPSWFPGLHPSFSPAQIHPPQESVDYPDTRWIEVDRLQVSIGKEAECPSYGWDNEYGERKVEVPPFRVASTLISNGDYWQFVADGGYQRSEFWTETGWRWRSYRNIKFPTFWVPEGPSGSHRYGLRTTFEVIPMQWAWPAVVNYHESVAYLNWRSAQDQSPYPYRLMSEAEHHSLRATVGLANEAIETLVVPEPYNTNLRWGSESSVTACTPAGHEVSDLFGNVWQWCEDHFNPLPGFRIHRFYDDFSTPCYDGQHQMIMGGSFISTGDEASPWARFHFRPHFFQHAGFRIAVSQDEGNGLAVHLEDATSGTRSGEVPVEQMLQLHFDGPFDSRERLVNGLPPDFFDFAARVSTLIIDRCESMLDSAQRALEVGCTVGGVSFLLTRYFEHVIGIDLNESYIAAASSLKAKGLLEYKTIVEGEIMARRSAAVPPELRERVSFRQADPCALPAEYTNFDAVVLTGVLERLPSPPACLGRMGGSRGIVRPGGLLVILSSYGWDGSITPKEVWPGGYLDEKGDAVLSIDGLHQMLSPEFSLVERVDLPWYQRETSRTYRLVVGEATFWCRR